MSARESRGPSSEVMGETPENPDVDVEKALDQYGEHMRQALSDLVVSKSASETDLRVTFDDCLVLSRCIESVIGDSKEILDLDAVQEQVDGIVSKHGLDPDTFSVHHLHKLIEEAEA